MKTYNFMNFKKNKNKYFILVLIFTLMACESDYTKLVKKELATDVKNNSLIFGLKFNDTKQQFFETCMVLNRKKMISQGPSNHFAAFTMKAKEKNESPIKMLFYGMFNDKNIMTGLKMRFYYDAWAPWNKRLYAKELVPSIKDTLQKWFPGNDFMKINVKKLKRKVFVKIDGNRQIKMFVLNDKEISVKIEDLDKKSEYNELAK